VCACAIQRELDDHRRSSGFALPVRIGLHTAEANQRGDDYSGVAVNVASRVAGLAGGGEIVATEQTLAEASGAPVGPPRDAELKGVSGTVTVANILWT
jgi:class 3 adenylate cyclase